jgi:hypothetical protein
VTAEEVDRRLVPRRAGLLWTGAGIRTLLGLLATMTAALVLLIPGMTAGGPPMDEGAILAYSDRVLDGAVPHRDFLTLYGPGNAWTVALAFELFGVSISVERGVALLYRLLIVVSVFVLARHIAGVAAAVAAGVIAALVLNGGPVWANATYAALAWALVGLVLAASAGATAPGRRRTLLLLGAGLAGGLSALMRFDFALVVLVSALPFLLPIGWRCRARYAVGFASVAALYVPHLAIVGSEKTARVVGDLIASGPGRRLPIPRPWDYPGRQLAAAALIAGVFLVVGAFLVYRRRAGVPERILLAAGLVTVCMAPYVTSRADVTHIEPATILPLSLLPAFALWLGRSLHLRAPIRIAVGLCALAFALLVVTNHEGVKLSEPAVTVESSSRKFYDGDPDRSRDISAVVARLEAASRPGESLFVGPRDLRRTNYGPTYIYYLVPQLEPASYYMEMNPQTANRAGSGLADELRAADWLVLTTDWDGEKWNEPNESRELGSSEPNQVVRDLFCIRFEARTYRLYGRCDRGGS